MTTCMGNDCSHGCPGYAFDGVLFVLSFSHERSWMRSGFELSEFLKVFRPSFYAHLFFFLVLFLFTTNYDFCLHIKYPMETVDGKFWDSCYLTTIFMRLVLVPKDFALRYTGKWRPVMDILVEPSRFYVKISSKYVKSFR